MSSFLKPWVPRFGKAFSRSSLESENQSSKSSVSQTVSAENEFETEVAKSLEKKNLDLLISASPLVSWRANCTIETERQTFLLTPLPISKTLLSSIQPEALKSVFERIAKDFSKTQPPFRSISMGTKYDLLKDIEIKPSLDKPSHLVATRTTSGMECGTVSTPKFSKSDCSMVVMTPCTSMRSPPKSCVLFEAISESSHVGKAGTHKSTRFPVGIKECSDSHISESSSGSEALDGLVLKFPELLGIRGTYKSGVTKKRIEASPDWFRSPPKTCLLIESSDAQILDNDVAAANCHLPMPVTGHVLKNQRNVPVLEVDSQDTNQQVKNSFQRTSRWQL